MKKSQVKKLDNKWSVRIKELANYRCEYCNVGGWMNSCHIVGRRNRTLRWNLKNGMCLCVPHHYAYDNHLPEHDDIVKKVIGKKRWNYLMKMKPVIAKHQDYDEVMKCLGT